MITIMTSNWFLEALVAGNITLISLSLSLFKNLAHYFIRTK